MVNSIQNGYSPAFQFVFDNAEKVTPAFAAAAAIIPSYPLFVRKSYRQMDKTPPRFHFGVFKGAVKAIPSISPGVALQIGIRNKLEAEYKSIFGIDHKTDSAEAKFVSSFLSAAATSFIWEVFNGQTMGKTVVEAFKGISAKKCSIITCRETSFLFTLSITEMVTKAMKEQFGDNAFVEYSSAFATGAIGSFFPIANAADVALTRWQNNQEMVYTQRFIALVRRVITKPSHPSRSWTPILGKSLMNMISKEWMKGSVSKATAVGMFYIFFVAALNTFQKQVNELKERSVKNYSHKE